MAAGLHAAEAENEGPLLATVVAAEQAAAAAGFVEVVLSLHVLVVRVTQPEDHAPAGHVVVGQDVGCLQLAAQQLVDGGPRVAQQAVKGLGGAAEPAAELLPFHAHTPLGTL